MANPIIRLKKSDEKDKAPASLAQGEVAVNYNAESPALYIQDTDGNVIKLADAGAAAAGKVQSVDGEAPIVVDNGDPLNPVIKFDDAPDGGADGTAQYARQVVTSGSGTTQTKTWAPVEIPPGTVISETAPDTPEDGQMWWADTDVADGGGRLYIWTGTEWVDVSIPGGALTQDEGDARYLSKTSDDTATGEITFQGLTTHESGVKVTGGTAAIGKGVIGYDNDTIGIVASGEVKASFSSQDGAIRFNGATSSDQISVFLSDRVYIGNAAGGNSGFSVTGDTYRTDGDEYSSVSVIDSPYPFNRANDTGVATYNGYYAYPTNNSSFPSGAAADVKIFGFHSNIGNLSGNAGTGAGKVALAAGFYANDLNKDVGKLSAGFYSALSVGVDPTTENYNFYAEGTAPNYFAGGVQFATAAGTSALDRYEEGTFTAQFTADPSITYGKQSGHYTIVGNLCTATYYVTWTALDTSDTGFAALSLPIAAAFTVDNYRSGTGLGYITGIKFTNQLIITLSGSNTYATIYDLTHTGTVPVVRKFSDFLSTGEIQTTISYQIA